MRNRPKMCAAARKQEKDKQANDDDVQEVAHALRINHFFILRKGKIENERHERFKEKKKLGKSCLQISTKKHRR
jgi:hypothetical protein